jgi:hypothetical protein
MTCSLETAGEAVGVNGSVESLGRHFRSFADPGYWSDCPFSLRTLEPSFH